MGTGQFYFSKAKLERLLAKFNDPQFINRLGGKELKGVVFTAGRKQDGQPCSYAFPVYSLGSDAGMEEAIIYQNTEEKDAGCPYPPPCDDGGVTGG